MQSLVDVHFLELSEPEVFRNPNSPNETVAGSVFEGRFQQNPADDRVLFLEEAVKELFAPAWLLRDLVVHELRYRQKGLELVSGQLDVQV